MVHRAYKSFCGAFKQRQMVERYHSHLLSRSTSETVENINRVCFSQANLSLFLPFALPPFFYCYLCLSNKTWITFWDKSLRTAAPSPFKIAKISEIQLPPFQIDLLNSFGVVNSSENKQTKSQ